MVIRSARFVVEVSAAIVVALVFKFALGNLIYTAQNHLRYAFAGFNAHPTALNLLMLFGSSFVLLRFAWICVGSFKSARK